MATMKAMQVKEPGGPFEAVDLAVPDPGRGWVRVKVEACGICHSDMFVKENLFPGLHYPRVPGHEVVGVVDALGEGVGKWKLGQRVGVGWHGGHCFHCTACRVGDFANCAEHMVTGIAFDGGYAEYMIAPAEALAAVPEGLEAVAAAPLLCAGITTYNALRNAGARPGDLVAVQGIGGLGHLGIQYASRMGFRTVAVSGSGAKRELAQRLGAHHYIDASAEDPAAALQTMGGARVILATAPSSKALEPLLGGLGLHGRVMLVGVDSEPIAISPLQLVGGRHSIMGWPSGSAIDSEDTMKFSVLSGVEAMIETFPLAKANEAYERMMGNQTRFRAVLVP